MNAVQAHRCSERNVVVATYTVARLTWSNRSAGPLSDFVWIGVEQPVLQSSPEARDMARISSRTVPGLRVFGSCFFQLRCAIKAVERRGPAGPHPPNWNEHNDRTGEEGAGIISKNGAPTTRRKQRTTGGRTGQARKKMDVVPTQRRPLLVSGRCLSFGFPPPLLSSSAFSLGSLFSLSSSCVRSWPAPCVVVYCLSL